MITCPAAEGTPRLPPGSSHNDKEIERTMKKKLFGMLLLAAMLIACLATAALADE